MNAATRRLVRERSDFRREYCRLHEDYSALSFHVEHIISMQHGGLDDLANLVWSCHEPKNHKGPNLSGRLRDSWGDCPVVPGDAEKIIGNQAAQNEKGEILDGIVGAEDSEDEGHHAHQNQRI